MRRLSVVLFLSLHLSISAADLTPKLKHFRENVQPILVNKCLQCHGSKRPRGGLDLSRRSTLIEGGNHGTALDQKQPEKSLLFQKVHQRKMPPKDPLSPEQMEHLLTWLKAGAPYEKEPLAIVSKRVDASWWSLQPVRNVTPPRGQSGQNPIDSFIRARLTDKKLSPSAPADRATLIRRAMIDLHGLAPTPEVIDNFVNDPDPLAYEKLIDRLLASPRYGERWARHWLDITRFAESHGYETNKLRFTAWPYRDYVIRAFNRDTPYPQFIREQLAADTIPHADILTQSATGFLVGGAHDVVGNQTVEGRLQQRVDDLDDIITATASTFMALTVNCARCHDHKFDPIAQKDYYQLQAIFAGVQHSERMLQASPTQKQAQELARLQARLAQVERELDNFKPLAQPFARRPRRLSVDPCCNVERFAPVKARFVRFTVLATNNRTEPCIDELEIYTNEKSPRNVALASLGAKATVSSVYPNNPKHKREHVNDGKHGNDRSWISRTRGKGWVQIELPRVETIDRILWGRDRLLQYKDRLPTDYRIEVALKPGNWTLIATSHDRHPYRANATKDTSIVPPELSPGETRQYLRLVRERQSLLKIMPFKKDRMSVYAGTFTQPGASHILLRGDPLRKAEKVRPDALSVIQPSLQLAENAPEKERRLTLARWLGRRDHPLTARVMVNRVWHYHFGRGIVSTPSDFGSNGSKPTHPLLLDWLARSFMDNGWRLKPLHKLIMTSATYRQQSINRKDALVKDRQNHLFWRMTPRRLEAEALRDRILQVSGNLNLRAGGPGYNLWQKNTNYVTVFKPKLELGPEEWRRMVYQFKPRSQQDPIFGVFDCPDAALARPRRTSSTTVLQALNLLNSRFLVRQSKFFALRVEREVGSEVDRQIKRAFRLAFGRYPSSREQKASMKVVREHGLSLLCRALLNANEFLYAD